MALNALQKERYISHGGTRCPFCDGTDITGGPIEVEGQMATQKMKCNEEECEKSWINTFILTDVEEEAL